jgi:hypothetical protein
MYKVCNIDLEQCRECFNKIEEYCQEVVRKLNPKLVLLFGSFAAEDINEGSDIDILVVSNFKEDFLGRIKVLFDLNRFGIPIEPIGYTAEEFERMRERKNPFLEEVIRKGKVLHGEIP